MKGVNRHIKNEISTCEYLYVYIYIHICELLNIHSHISQLMNDTPKKTKATTGSITDNRKTQIELHYKRAAASRD